MRRSTGSLASRAFLALVLLVGFYVLTAAVIVGLLYIPYAELRATGGIHIYLAAACVLAAVLLGWSVIPRREPFVAPGPRLLEKENPELFHLLDEVAHSVGERVPRDVYLIPEANAYVAQVETWMGLGGRRIIGIGLPLIAHVSHDGLRAIVAHEFGHFTGGDTRLGPIVYGTRRAMGEAMASMETAPDAGPWIALIMFLLHWPFRAYAAMYMRVTQAVSRAQEYTADRLAAEVAGAAAFGAALRSMEVVDRCWHGYLRNEVEGVLALERRPPLADGFRRYLRSPAAAEALRLARKRAHRGRGTNPYDSHPPLPERLRALGVRERDPSLMDHDGPPATSLLGRPLVMEGRLIAVVGGRRAMAAWPVVSWDRMASTLLRPAWKERAARAASALQGIRIEKIPRTGEAMVRLGRAIARAARIEDVAERPLALQTLASILALALEARGASIEMAPGHPLVMRVGQLGVEPMAEIDDVALGRTSGKAWVARCRELGIPGLDLGAEASRFRTGGGT